MNSNLLLGILIGIFALPLLIGLPIQALNKKRGKTARRTAGAAIGVMDEVFHPNAKEARIIIEQKQEERVPLPSPEGKPLP